MFEIRKEQFDELERVRLVAAKRDIAARLRRQYPASAARLGNEQLDAFVRDWMNAGRSLWVVELDDLRQFVELAFIVNYVSADPRAPEIFGRIMLTEEDAKARLSFAQACLLPGENRTDYRR
jgi:hypothetical protein